MRRARKRRSPRPATIRKPPTDKQRVILARYGLTAYSLEDATQQISRLQRNGWKLPAATTFEHKAFPVLPGMAKEESTDDAMARGIEGFI